MPDPNPLHEYATPIVSALGGAVASLLAALGLRGNTAKRVKSAEDCEDVGAAINATRAQADAAHRRIDNVTTGCAEHRSRLTGLEHDQEALEAAIARIDTTVQRVEGKLDQLLLRGA